jgi:hypothetical protein
VKQVNDQGSDNSTCKRASNRVACATKNPLNGIVKGTELGEQLCHGDIHDKEGSHRLNNDAVTSGLGQAKVDSTVHGYSCSQQESVMMDMVAKTSEFLAMAADLMQRLSVAVPPKNQLDVEVSHIASGFGPEHGCRL